MWVGGPHRSREGGRVRLLGRIVFEEWERLFSGQQTPLHGPGLQLLQATHQNMMFTVSPWC
jgi:hypothetical protein